MTMTSVSRKAGSRFLKNRLIKNLLNQFNIHVYFYKPTIAESHFAIMNKL